MVDAYCNRKDCKAPIDGDEFGMSIMDYSSKEEYLQELQSFHDQEHHTTEEEKLTCECGHKSKDVTEAIDHIEKCPKLGDDNKK